MFETKTVSANEYAKIMREKACFGLTERECDEYLEHSPRIFEYMRNHYDGILRSAVELQPPLKLGILQDYLTGFSVSIIPFDKEATPDRCGYWDIDDDNEQITICYAEQDGFARQRFSAAHEFVHVFQYLDPQFQSLLGSVTSPEVRKKIVERVADKAAAYFLMPPWLVLESYKRNPDIDQLAQEYQVSVTSMKIAVNDYINQQS
jgi:hypothetical protein